MRNNPGGGLLLRQVPPDARRPEGLAQVAEGDARLLGYLTLGAIKELLFQVVLRGAEYEPQLLVDAIFAFLSKGYLRAGASSQRK